MAGDKKSSPSNNISLGAVPIADPNRPPLTIESRVLSSVGVNTPSSSKGINSTNAPASGIEVSVNAVVEPSPLKISLRFFLVLSSDVTYTMYTSVIAGAGVIVNVAVRPSELNAFTLDTPYESQGKSYHLDLSHPWF